MALLQNNKGSLFPRQPYTVNASNPLGTQYVTLAPTDADKAGTATVATGAMNGGVGFAGGLGNAFGGYGGALTGMYAPYTNTLSTGIGAMANMYGSYGNAFGGLAGAIGGLANGGAANQDRYSAYAQGNNAYQNMLGNLGAASLAGYGSAANAAMQTQALNSTAWAKAMSDAIASNQMAVGNVGASRNNALAGLAGSYAGAGTGFGNARASLGQSAAQMAGNGAAAYANLGSALGTAAGNTASAGSQAEAALRTGTASSAAQLGGAAANAHGGLRTGIGNSLANLRSAEAGGQSALGSSASGAYGALGGPTASAASNDLNYTRDMAKLGLARELGLATTGVLGSSLGGTGGNVSIYGPGGMIGSGGFGSPSNGAVGSYNTDTPSSFTPAPFSAAASSDNAAVPTQQSAPWYASRQDANGTGVNALSGLRDAVGAQASSISRRLSRGANRGSQQIMQQGDAGENAINSTYFPALNQIRADAVEGSQGIRDTTQAGLGQIASQGRSGRQGILAALNSGSDTLRDSSDAMTRNENATFAGMAGVRNDLMGGDVLNQLGSSYGAGMQGLLDAYSASRQDPKDIMGSLASNMTNMAAPYVGYGTAALQNFYQNFPAIYQPSPTQNAPYINALLGAWDPFIKGLGSAMDTQSGRINDLITQSQGGYNTGLNTLNDAWRGTRDDMGTMYRGTVGGFADATMPTGPFGGSIGGGGGYDPYRPAPGPYGGGTYDQNALAAQRQLAMYYR